MWKIIHCIIEILCFTPRPQYEAYLLCWQHRWLIICVWRLSATAGEAWQPRSDREFSEENFVQTVADLCNSKDRCRPHRSRIIKYTVIDRGCSHMESTVGATNMAVSTFRICYSIRPYITHHWAVNICLIGDLNLCLMINSKWSGLTCIQAKPNNFTVFRKYLHWMTGNTEPCFCFPVAQVSHRWGLNRLEEILSAFLCFFRLTRLLNQTEGWKE